MEFVCKRNQDPIKKETNRDNDKKTKRDVNNKFRFLFVLFRKENKQDDNL